MKAANIGIHPISHANVAIRKQRACLDWNGFRMGMPAGDPSRASSDSDIREKAEELNW